MKIVFQWKMTFYRSLNVHYSQRLENKKILNKTEIGIFYKSDPHFKIEPSMKEMCSNSYRLLTEDRRYSRELFPRTSESR